MKLLALLHIAALGGFGLASIIPSEKVLQESETSSSRLPDHQSSHEQPSDTRWRFRNQLQDTLDEVANDFENLVVDYAGKARDSVHGAVDHVSSRGGVRQSIYNIFKDATKYAGSAKEHVEESELDSVFGSPERSLDGHGGHHHKPNQTVYQLIAKSKYTTKLAKLIGEFPDLVNTLNNTKANYTVFAPTDYAFSKIPEHAPKPSKEQLHTLLTYHVSPDFYPAGRVLVTKTIPTLLESKLLGGEQQRLAINIGLRGLTVNFYARIIAINIFGTNGVIHGVDSLILPPPRAIEVVDLIPDAFSTLELGLVKTGLLDQLNGTRRAGGTLFAPSNDAFSKLGPRINGFLFSRYGLKYLKGLLQYHVAPKRTLYSDAYYEVDDDDSQKVKSGPPRGLYHYELPTLLEDRSISVDVARWARFIELRINGFSRVAISDAVARDGVIQVVGNVLIPPKQRPDDDEKNSEDTMITLEELKERLEPFIAEDAASSKHDAWDSSNGSMMDDFEVLR
ncbi:MAG: hypothetical protein M1831_004590 [Alyxoria varia]|nr:MAG: hypothetical protein M1831_004590 [Alyxoria varia]